MPARAVPSCQARHRATQIQGKRYGISDAILAAVFAQYCSVTKIQVRHGSFVPGPFENRRRNGRRRMGELRLGQTAGSAAAWELENVPDLTQWRWNPPSSAARRIRQTLRAGHKSFLRTVLHSSLHPLSTLWGFISTLIHPEAVTVHASNATPIDFIELGFAQISNDFSRDPTLSNTPKFHDYCQYLQEALAAGRLKGSDVTVLFSNLHQGLCALASEQLCGSAVKGTVHGLVLTLVRSVVTGVAELNKRGQVVHDSQLYGSLLSALSELSHQNAQPVLRTVVGSIPEECIGALTQELDLTLEVFVFRAAANSNFEATAEREFVETWSILDSTQHLAILNAATRTSIKSFQSSREGSSKARMIWLTMLARLPHVDMDYLATACACAEAGRSTAPLSQRDVCSILLAHLTKHRLAWHRGSAANPQSLKLGISRNRRMSPFYSLGGHLSKSGDVASLLKAAKFLTSAGREQNVWQLLQGARQAIKSDKSVLRRKKMPLFDLAFASQSLPIIIKTLEKYAESPSSSVDYWYSQESLTDLTRITSMRTLSRLQVLEALQLCPRARGRSTPKLMHKPNVQTQKAVRLAQAAVANAPRSPRAAFETVFHCVNFVRRREGTVPSPLLKCVHQLVKNDLESGRSGVQVRLIWYLDLVGMKSGADIRLKTAQSLQKWRDHNQELARQERLQAQE